MVFKDLPDVNNLKYILNDGHGEGSQHQSCIKYICHIYELIGNH